MAADGCFDILFGDVAALHDQLISHHDGRSCRQAQPAVFLGPVFLVGFGYGLDFNLVLFPQPGDQFGEMPSGLSARCVQEESEF